MDTLENCRAIVTGASRGIGRAIAERLAADRAKLALVARSGDLLDEAVTRCRDLGAEAEAFVCDVSDADQVEGQFGKAITRLGGIDLLVNNAGLGYMGSVDELAVAQFDEMLGTNLRGVFLCSRAVVPTMKAAGGGVIINISSIAGKAGFLGGAGYAASKFGVMGLSESMGLDLRPHNIRVAAVCPGSVNAPDFRRDRPGRINAENMIQAEDVAEACAYIATQPDRIFIRELEMRVTNPG